MAIYMICNEKGGAGKSSLAQSLAVYFLRQGKEVLLIDADPQRTTTEWAQEREEGALPPISCVEMGGNIRLSLEAMRERYAEVVVDCGGADSRAMRSALSVANVAILPFRPKRRDLKVAPGMAEVIETARALNPALHVVSVITQAPTHPNQHYRIASAQELLAGLGLSPISNFTRNLNAWDDAEESGCSVLEYPEDRKAAEDAVRVFDEIVEAAHG